MKAFRFLCRGGRQAPELEQLDASLAARALARRRQQLEREPIKARARQICAELGRPVPPALAGDGPRVTIATESRPHNGRLRSPAPPPADRGNNA